MLCLFEKGVFQIVAVAIGCINISAAECNRYTQLVAFQYNFAMFANALSSQHWFCILELRHEYRHSPMAMFLAQSG